MRHRLIGSIGVVATLVVVPSISQTLLAQSRSTAKAAIPRTPDGKPDLQGAWSFANVTPFERPSELGEKTTLTEAEAQALEEQAAARNKGDEGRQRGTAADVGRAYNDFWYDRGTRAASTRQTSIVVDPPNGRVPAVTAEAQERASTRAAARKQRGPADGPEDRSLGERCLLFNAGPPMLSGPYNNYVQILQTPDHVVILNEMIHDARVVPTDGRPHLDPSIRRFQGDPVGHWEGKTLVVDTTNFTDKTNFRGASAKLHLVERFTRTDVNTLLYEFTIDDPASFASPWRVQLPMKATSEAVFEYACHEGNEALPGILRGARFEERQK